MAIVMAYDYSGESVDTVDQAYFLAQYGDDGPANGGDPELLLGGPSSDLSDRITWDAGTFEDGAWQGWSNFAVDANAGGGSAGFELDSPGATSRDLVYTGDTYGRITDISFSAESDLADATIEFENVDVEFYSGGKLVDTYQADTGAQATAADDGTTAQQIVDVSPSTFADSAKITFQVRMLVPSGDYPGPTDLQAKIGIGSTSGGPA